MNTLADAWRWYEDSKKSLKLIHRLGEKHWLKLSTESLTVLRHDDRFRQLEPQDITGPAKNALKELDDLAIVVMFSVFEGIVRDRILDEINPEKSLLRHQSLISAADDAIAAIGTGSFFHVLAPYRRGFPSLSEEVDQVREYRNWVAHGKRSKCKHQVDPGAAFDRLSRFLEATVKPSIA